MKRVFFMLAGLMFAGFLYAQPDDSVAGKKRMLQLIKENFSFAEKQYAWLEKHTPYDSMPRTFENGKNVNSNTAWWCSGFYTGSLWYLYEYSKNALILEEAKKRLAALEPEKNDTSNHDLGFKIYCSFGNAYRLTREERYKTVIVSAANSLATRYRPAIRSIQSWNKSDKYNCPVIIDNMMNLEMLEWASKNGGSENLGTIAVIHANTTLKNHFRNDYSSFHVVDYDLSTGKIIKKVTAQGANDSSAWSRGQGWALYGFTMMYRFTKDPAYLKQARGVAEFILNNPHLPEDKVPYWDFKAPGIPDAPRDVSSAAVYASALLELSRYTGKEESEKYMEVAKTILCSLSTDKYRAKPGENGGFLLMHSVGSIPHKAEVDVPLSYADYYFLEALLRYKRLLEGKEVVW